jgi:predicted metal-dependent enzyme (double-stranded beta helix superfamily)
MAGFDVETLVADCRAARSADMSLTAMRDVLDRHLARPSVVADVLGRPEGGIETLHHSPELTVLNVVWAPGMRLYPHDHRMWAAIGIYGGTEDNEFFRRAEGGLQPSGGKSLREGEVVLLGDDTIHAVANPLDSLTGAIHVYGGDFFTQPRSEWDPETLEERPYDVEHARQVFAEANRAHAGEPGLRSRSRRYS